MDITGNNKSDQDGQSAPQSPRTSKSLVNTPAKPDHRQSRESKRTLKSLDNPPTEPDHVQSREPKRTLKSLVNTPFKKVMFGVQILSYILIVGSPAIGGFIGKVLELTKGQTAGVIFGVFIAGEVLFYGSLAFLGKELILLLKDRFRSWFSVRKKRRE